MAELFTAIEVGGEAQAGGGVITRDVEISECCWIGTGRVGQTDDVIGVWAAA